MSKFIHEKPWYFLLTILGFIIQPILEWFVMYFFDEEKVKSVLQSSFTIKISDILPWCFCGAIFFVCLGIYIYQLKNANSKVVSSEEKTMLTQILEKAVDENEYIESMQAFQYKVKNGQTEKYIKLSYLTGAANERIEINTILQTYFYFNYSIYKRIVKVSDLYDTYKNESDPMKKSNCKTAFLEEGNNLCTALLNTLNAIEDVDHINESHCDMYRVLARLLPAISERAIEKFLENSDIERELIKRKKTGILGAVIVKDLYIFRNETSIVKNNRIYFVFPYNDKKNIVFLGSINGLCIPPDDDKAVDNYCKLMVECICNGQGA